MSNTVPLFILYAIVEITANVSYMVSDIFYSNIGAVAEKEKENCLADEECLGQTIRENSAIYDSFLWFVYIVLGYSVLCFGAYMLLYKVLCNSGQNIHDCSVAGKFLISIRILVC